MRVPFVQKDPISIVATEASEAYALRGVLEYFNYRVDLILIGSRTEFIKVLAGDIKTERMLIFAVHGTKEGIHITNEDSVTERDIVSSVQLEGKSVISLGCETGRSEYADAFKKGGVQIYIAPVGYPEGNASLMFVMRLFYELKNGTAIVDAVAAAIIDKETKMFKLHA